MSTAHSIARLRQEEFEGDDSAVTLDGAMSTIRPRSFGLVDDPAEPERRSALALDDVYETMEALASGVTLVTTFHDARPWGVTVTSCSSLSLRPPRLLVALARSSTTFRAIEAVGIFGVSLLSDAHRHLAQSSGAPGAPKFLDAAVLTKTPGVRSPIIAGTLSHLDCEVEEVFEGDGYAIIVGEVVAAIRRRPDSCSGPLLYFDRAFHHLGSPL